MNKISIYLLTIFYASSMHAQRIVWEKASLRNPLNQYESLLSTSDGGFLLVADSLRDIDTTDFKKGLNKDVHLLKFDKNGKLKSKKKYQVSNCHDHSFEILKNGGYMLTGWTSSNFSYGGLDSLDGTLVKLGRKEEIIWKKAYGGSKEDVFRATVPTADGGYIVAGDTHSSDGDVHSGNKGGSDIWVVKLNNKGDIQWEKSYGGSSDDHVKKIYRVADGYILGANTKSCDGDVKSGNKGENDIWIFKIDKNGQLIWEKTYGGTQYDYFSDLQPTKDGGHIVVGFTRSSDGSVQSVNHGWKDGWILKLDNHGNIQWEKCFGGSNDDHLDRVVNLPDGCFAAAGVTSSADGDVKDNTVNKSGYWIIRLDNNGNLLNEKTFGILQKDFKLKDLKLCKDGGILLGGSYTNKRIIFYKSWILKVVY